MGTSETGRLVRIRYEDVIVSGYAARRSLRNPIQPVARPKAMEMTARIPCTTFEAWLLSSWPAMITSLEIHT